MVAKGIKCPVCQGPCHTGSVREVLIDPGKGRLEDRVWLHVYYCQKSDAHTFGIIERRKVERWE